jgi:hypothetical protein
VQYLLVLWIVKPAWYREEHPGAGRDSDGTVRIWIEQICASNAQVNME